MAENSVYPSLSMLEGRLRERGGRITAKRRRILEALRESRRPLTADEARIGAGLPASDLVTVYRNLEAFEAAGFLQKVPLESGTNLFELIAPDEHFHHLVCRKCLRTERIDVCLGSHLESIARARGFREIAHVIEVYGICANCEAQPGGDENPA